MDDSRRSFLKILPAGAAAIGLSTVGLIAEATEVTGATEVPLFVCGNCIKWEEAKKVIAYRTGSVERAQLRVNEETDGRYDGKTQRLLANIQDYIQEDKDTVKSEIPVTWKTKSRIPRQVTYPGKCPLLKNQCAYSDDPACENFGIKKGELIVWKEG